MLDISIEELVAVASSARSWLNPVIEMVAK